MSSSALYNNVFQAKISNVQNAADSSAVYSAGVWSFKNSTAVTSVTITDAGDIRIGTTSSLGAVDRLTVVGGNVAVQRTAGIVTAIGDNTQQGYVGTISNHPFLFLTNTIERMRLDASGNLLVNKTSANDGTFHVRSLSTSARAIGVEVLVTSDLEAVSFRNPNGVVGSINTNGSNTAFLTSSDYRLKEDVKPMVAALSKVAALKPCTYKWKIDGSEGEGFIAHELAEVCPAAVSGEKDAVNEDGSIKSQGIDQSKLVALLTAAIQELSAKVDAQAAEIEALKAK